MDGPHHTARAPSNEAAEHRKYEEVHEKVAHQRHSNDSWRSENLLDCNYTRYPRPSVRSRTWIRERMELGEHKSSTATARHHRVHQGRARGHDQCAATHRLWPAVGLLCDGGIFRIRARSGGSGRSDRFPGEAAIRAVAVLIAELPNRSATPLRRDLARLRPAERDRHEHNSAAERVRRRGS